MVIDHEFILSINNCRLYNNFEKSYSSNTNHIVYSAGNISQRQIMPLPKYRSDSSKLLLPLRKIQLKLKINLIHALWLWSLPSIVHYRILAARLICKNLILRFDVFANIVDGLSGGVRWWSTIDHSEILHIVRCANRAIYMCVHNDLQTC